MKKGFSMLVAVVLAAGLCACGSGGRSASDDPSKTQHVSKVHTVVRPPVCPTKSTCVV